jgi:hypothetical protein
MSMPQKRRKRYNLFALAVLVFLSGVVALVMAPRYSAIRAFAGLSFLIALWLVNASNVHTRSGLAATIDPASKLSGRVMWFIGLALLAAWGMSFLYLYKDALGGYHGIAAVYIFAGVAVVCLVFWLYLISKLPWGGRS